MKRGYKSRGIKNSIYLFFFTVLINARWGEKVVGMMQNKNSGPRTIWEGQESVTTVRGKREMQKIKINLNFDYN